MSVRLLFDENLSFRLVERLADIFPGSIHILDSGLSPRSDLAIWNFARLDGFIIVSKDRDFQEFSLDMGHPPKLIAIGTGNCSTARIESLLRRQAIRINIFSGDDAKSVLILR